MKIKLHLLFLCLFFMVKMKAQVPEEFNFFGRWIKQGFEFSGSFYPVNYWNSETITFGDDYTFTKVNLQLNDQKIDTIKHYGKWNWNAETKILRLFRDEERYYSSGKIFIFEKEYNLAYLSSSYFTFSGEKFDQKVEFVFQKEGTVQTLEENIAFEAQKKSFNDVKIDSLSTFYFLVNASKPLKRQKMYFDEFQYHIAYKEHNLATGILEQTGYFDGAIKDFTDSSIRFIYSEENIRTDYADGKSSDLTNRYFKENINEETIGLQTETYAEREILLSDLTQVELSRKFNTSGISPTVVLFSVLTTLFVAPLVSINYKNGNFSQSKYYTTAGIGLIGLGASIPLYYLFRDKKISFYQNDGVVNKRTMRLEKVRL